MTPSNVIQSLLPDTTITFRKGKRKRQLQGHSEQQLLTFTDKAAVAPAKRRGWGSRGDKKEKQTMTTMDNTCNNQTKRGTGWRKMAAVVVSCNHSAQDVCMVNKVCKYHSMCKMVENVHTAVETQRRTFCSVSRYSISKTNGRS
jgi:hypothetical protein